MSSQNLRLLAFNFTISVVAALSTTFAQAQTSKPTPIYDPASRKANVRSVPRPHGVSSNDTTNSGSPCSLITFEGLGNLAAIPNFFGISLPDWLSIIQDTDGGSGNFANAPGGNTIAFWLNGNPTSQTINIPNGAAQISLYYSSAYTITLSAYDGNVAAHAALRGLAVALMKIANDMRWLASGPRCGIAELNLPENEPGSSIMPRKVNPTQCEAIVMICIQVIGDDTAVAFAGSQGNFELNAMRPILINNFLHSARILADGCEKFRIYSVEGTQINEKKIAEYLQNSLMLVTALSPVIGYDNASKIAHTAHHDGSTLREAAIKTGLIDPDTFDKVVNPQNMVGDTTLILPEQPAQMISMMKTKEALGMP
jgi:hypothetical protein